MPHDWLWTIRISGEMVVPHQHATPVLDCDPRIGFIDARCFADADQALKRLTNTDTPIRTFGRNA
jgi:hypothetical protein